MVKKVKGMGYDDIKAHPQRVRRKETNDCSVIALAIACGCSYAKAHRLMKLHGRKNRDGAWAWQVSRAASDMGFRLKAVNVSAKTLGMLPYELSRSGHYGRFIVKTSSHFAAIVDGRVEDWSSGRLLRIEAVYKVSAD